MINSKLFDDPGQIRENTLRAELLEAILSLQKTKEFLLNRISSASKLNKDYSQKKLVKMVYK